MAGVDSAYPSIEQRVDNYVRGKMSEDEERNFELEYFSDEALMDLVERAQMLKQVVVEFPARRAVAVSEPRRAWWHYFWVPQTGWGAAFATLLLVPMLVWQGGPATNDDLHSIAVLHLGEQVVRSAEPEIESFHVDAGTEQVVLSLDVGPQTGLPALYRVELLANDGQLLQVASDLAADAKAKVYVQVSLRNLEKGSIHYRLVDQDRDAILSEGQAEVLAQ